MHNLFNLSVPPGMGVQKVSEWLYVRAGLKRNLEVVTHYNRKFPKAVQSNHILVRLLHSLNVPMSHSLERYYGNVDSVALNVAMALKMTSSIGKGRIFKGVFYGLGSEEFLVAHDTPFNPFEAHDNWRDLRPVEVLRHPFSDLGLAIPDGEEHYSESGMSIISINIPLLAVMYRAFRLNEQKVLGDSESQHSLPQFLRMYVLPNMLYSHLDIALFNRMDNLQKGAPLGTSTYEHPFYITDYSARCDFIQETILGKIGATNLDFVAILRTIPAVTHDNMDQVMELPAIPPTRQVIAQLLLSRLNVVSFLVRVSRWGPFMRNQMEINDIRRVLLALRTDRVFREMLPTDMYFDVESELETLTKAE